MVRTVAITCNGCEPTNLYPVFVLGSAAAASGDEVILFFTPGAGPALKKGELEKLQMKGMPDIMELLEGVILLGGRIMLCELALEAKDIKKEELRDDVEICGATSFLGAVKNPCLTFSF